VGTTSIEKSERLSSLLESKGIPHSVLNAKRHAFEAEIVAQAGRKGAVTVATNMAGRGTDIVLGGNPDRLLEMECASKGWAPGADEAKARLAELREACSQEQQEIKSLGGLLVIGTERHEARRIDNQLRGRCGRQGDPGESKFYLSFDDDLMRIFARDWVKTMMEKLGLKEGERIESGMVTRGIERAQKKVEARNFDIRKNLIEYDEVADKQRKFVYEQRQAALEMDDLEGRLSGMFEEVLEPILEAHSGDKDEPVDYAEIRGWLQHKAGDAIDLEGLESVGRDELFDWICQRFQAAQVKRREQYGAEDWSRVLQFLILDTIDQKWKDHLHAMEVLKAGISLRSFAQIDPKNEFKKEGWEKFKLLKAAVADQVTSLLFRVELRREAVQAPPQPPKPKPRMPQLPPDPVTAQAMVEAMIAAGQAPPEVLEAVRKGGQVRVRTQQDVQREQQEAARKQAEEQAKRQEADRIRAEAAAGRIGRNDPCPCGSGKKFKKCHGS
ncbi:MAG: SEC-C metal-binding domain-containing protein, partial [Planctomycetota bacterium]